MSKICVVIPTKNEEKSVAAVVFSVKEVLSPLATDGLDIIVVDDSTDGTRRLARAAGAEVLNGGGRGLGSAMYEGLKAAASKEPDFIVSVDGDGQADVVEIPTFLAPLLEDRADLVVGSRFLEKRLVQYRYRLVNRFGTIVLAWILRRLTGLPLTDSHGGLRAMRRDVAEELEMLGTHTYVQETIIDAKEKGFRILEIPSVWKVRRHGKSRVVSSVPRYVFYSLPVLILRSGEHIRLLYSSGILVVAAALLYFFTILVEVRFDIKQVGDRVPAFVWITLLISIGFQCFCFGFILQLVKQMKYRLDRTVQSRSRPTARSRGATS
jgi:glycosyltransferase involved in cell wall biosynthesis